MIFGVVLFSMLSASITELVIIDSIENVDLKHRRNKIQEIVIHYNLANEPRKVLNLLGESLYLKDLSEEYNFIAKLPDYYRSVVMLRIYEIYQNKINIFKNQNFAMFDIFYQKFKLRKCVEGEIVIDIEDKMTNI